LISQDRMYIVRDWAVGAPPRRTIPLVLVASL
jgi:hypothetical protein